MVDGGVVVARPAITWAGAHPANFERGRGGVALEGVVLHVMEGTLAGCTAWFNDPAARASTHFAVGKDGAIVQYVDLADTAYAHGAVEVASAGAPRLLRENAGINPNRFLVGIEHEGWSGRGDMTPAMFASSTSLTAWLFAAVFAREGATGVRVDREHILRHGEISPRSRTRCPGYPETTITRYVERVAALVGQAAAGAPAPAPESSELTARLRRLEDALTLQATALEELATRAGLQAANLRAALA
jgi:hypothetical protein